jgi:hypothetical protein
MDESSVVTISPIDVAAQCIEISGWDADGCFFVEIAHADITDARSASTHIRRRVSDGSLVFVRHFNLLVHGAQSSHHPTANEVRISGAPDFAGRYPIRLIRCRSHHAHTAGDRDIRTCI